MSYIRNWVFVGMVLCLSAMQSACVNTNAPVDPEPTPVNSEQVAATLAVRGGAVNRWQPLAVDDLHDPKNPSLQLLQEPSIVLSTLSGNKSRLSVGSYATRGVGINPDGNGVDWVQSLRYDLISPRRARAPSETPVEREELVMDMDMFLDLNGSMPMVRFPHLAHTLWLACSNCHPEVFVPQSGANRLSMEKILSGEQCGICHRAVAFPPTDCARCHSLAHDSPEGMMVKAQARAKARAKLEAKVKAMEEIEAEAAEKATKAAPSEKKLTQPKDKLPTKNTGLRP